MSFLYLPLPDNIILFLSMMYSAQLFTLLIVSQCILLSPECDIDSTLIPFFYADRLLAICHQH